MSKLQPEVAQRVQQTWYVLHAEIMTNIQNDISGKNNQLELESWINLPTDIQVVQKTDTQFYFWDNFGNSASILTIISLLQAESYGALT